MADEKTQAQKAKEALDAANKAKEEATLKAEPVKEAQPEPVKEAQPEPVKEVQPQPDKDGFLNPFIQGVTYDSFNKARGGKPVESYCKDKLSKEQIAWISLEIKSHKENKKK